MFPISFVQLYDSYGPMFSHVFMLKGTGLRLSLSSFPTSSMKVFVEGKCSFQGCNHTVMFLMHRLLEMCPLLLFIA